MANRPYYSGRSLCDGCLCASGINKKSRTCIPLLYLLPSGFQGVWFDLRRILDERGLPLSHFEQSSTRRVELEANVRTYFMMSQVAISRGGGF